MRSACLALLCGALFGTASAEESPKPRQWIVVTTEALRPAVEPLVTRRREQGWRIAEIVLPNSADKPATPATIAERIGGLVEGFEGTTAVLLVGDHESKGIAPFAGTHGRMASQRTDHPYGRPDAKGAVTIAVGRLPAQNVAEARAMVAKTLALEDRSPETGTNRIHLLLGDPGARTKLEERLSRAVVRNMAETRLGVLHPMWRPVCVADTPGSRFSVNGETFDEAAPRLLEEGHLLVGYAGHSGATGLWSPGRRKHNVPREVFETLDQGTAPGVFVTCGCWSCQIDGAGGPGYLLAAIRNPKGPAAGIGAFGESYAAFGQFTLDGVVNLFAGDEPPRTLGEYWVAAQHGIVDGKMGSLQFWLYDHADGSGGQVPMAAQRLEHAEMWTLLGDPGLRLPFVRPTLPVTVVGEARPGGTLEVAFTVPEGVDVGNGRANVLVEPRQLRWGDVAPTRKGVDRPGGLASQEVPIENGRADVRLDLPAELPDGDLVVRVRMGVGSSAVFGAGAVARAIDVDE